MKVRSDWQSIKDPYYAKQWVFCSAVSQRLATIDAEKVLEIGPWTYPIVPGCDTMDIKAKLKPTFVHDASKKWPIKSKAYDVCIALQVFEHFGPAGCGRQELAFAEAFRVAPIVVVSLPYHWPKQSPNNHGNIGLQTIIGWAGGREPDYVETITHSAYARILCIWGALANIMDTARTGAGE